MINMLKDGTKLRGSSHRVLIQPRKKTGRTFTMQNVIKPMRGRGTDFPSVHQ